MKNNRHNMIVLVCVIMLNIAALGAYYFLFADIERKNERIASVTETIDSTLKKERALVSLRNIAADTDKDREKLSDHFVGKDGVADFIEMVENLAKTRSLEFNVASIGVEDIPDMKEENTHAYLKLRLQTRGTWSDTMNFYLLLENLPYAVKFGLAEFVQESSADPKAGGKGSRWRGEADFSVVTLR